MKNNSHQITIENMIKEEFRSNKKRSIFPINLPEVLVISTFPPRELISRVRAASRSVS